MRHNTAPQGEPHHYKFAVPDLPVPVSWIYELLQFHDNKQHGNTVIGIPQNSPNKILALHPPAVIYTKLSLSFFPQFLDDFVINTHEYSAYYPCEMKGTPSYGTAGSPMCCCHKNLGRVAVFINFSLIATSSMVDCGSEPLKR